MNIYQTRIIKNLEDYQGLSSSFSQTEISNILDFETNYISSVTFINNIIYNETIIYFSYLSYTNFKNLVSDIGISWINIKCINSDNQYVLYLIN